MFKVLYLLGSFYYPRGLQHNNEFPAFLNSGCLVGRVGEVMTVSPSTSAESHVSFRWFGS